ncbi:MAG: hypothetical protein LUE61_07130 [Clostridiales bacterium]|nr:hypothetical protein [Clostridiales bacterium]
MGIPVLILGESGSGKSTSLRNFEPAEISIFNVASKPLPFRKKLPKQNGANYQSIQAALSAPNKKSYAIDDSQYLMCFDSFARAKETGYGKFTDMALAFYNLVQFVIKQTPADCIVYFLHHVDADSNTGKARAKTLGKMLDNQLTLEGLFAIVLLCEPGPDGYHFITQSDGTNTCKSPMEMLPATMDNDLKAVDTAIRDYWNLGGTTND